MSASPAIRVEGSARVVGATVFDPLTLEIPSGEWTCLLGPSGVGKSSLLRILADLAGDIEFQGRISTSDTGALRGRIAYMAQSDLLFPWLNVRDNVLLGATLRRERADTDRAERLISQVGLSDHADRRPDQLSGGQRQRAALARTLMEDRPVALLDEPFSALDARTRAEMQDLSADLLAGRTVLLVTHDPAEAARLGHTIHVMTGKGLTPVDMPDTTPVRGISDPATIALQTRLFNALMEPA